MTKMMIGPYEVQVTPRTQCRRMVLRYRRQEGKLMLSTPPHATAKEIRAAVDGIKKGTVGAPAAWTPGYAPGERHLCLGRVVTLGVDAPAGKEAFLRWRNEQLLPVIRRLLKKWKARMGVRVTHVTLQEMTSRWGSCRAATGRLTFNTRLGLYEEALIEETVVHELCHFFHQNHSAAFYAEMTKWLPDWRARKQRRDRMDVQPKPPAGG